MHQELLLLLLLLAAAAIVDELAIMEAIVAMVELTAV